MDIGREVEVVEVEQEPSVPYEGEEVSPEYEPEPEEVPAEVGS